MNLEKIASKEIINSETGESEIVSTAVDDQFDVCEVLVTTSNTGKVTKKETCILFHVSNDDNRYQLNDFNDGEKTLNIYFYTKNNYGNKADSTLKRKVVKKIIVDTMSPVITITGGDNVYIPKGSGYVESGATCIDDSGVVSEEGCKVTIEPTTIDLNKSG